jgi:hypothetical protein
MASYFVRMPLMGVLTVTVEADSEAEAKEKALRADWALTMTSADGVEIDECDVYRATGEGNVTYAPLNEISAELEE